MYVLTITFECFQRPRNYTSLKINFFLTIFFKIKSDIKSHALLLSPDDIFTNECNQAETVSLVSKVSQKALPSFVWEAKEDQSMLMLFECYVKRCFNAMLMVQFLREKIWWVVCLRGTEE